MRYNLLAGASMKYQSKKIKTFSDLESVLLASDNPVLLLEGTRKVASSDEDALTNLAVTFAERLPNVVFRSGNATGSDVLFSRGIEKVDPERMEYVLPYERMGASRIAKEGVVRNLGQLSKVAETSIARFTVEATPEYRRIVEYYRKNGRKSRLGAKAVYLMRDALKVVGSEELGLSRATAGLFYVNDDDPLGGGTGHTIRVCLNQRVPVVSQGVWRHWID